MHWLMTMPEYEPSEATLRRLFSCLSYKKFVGFIHDHFPSCTKRFMYCQWLQRSRCSRFNSSDFGNWPADKILASMTKMAETEKHSSVSIPKWCGHAIFKLRRCMNFIKLGSKLSHTVCIVQLTIFEKLFGAYEMVNMTKWQRPRLHLRTYLGWRGQILSLECPVGNFCCSANTVQTVVCNWIGILSGT